MPLTVGVLIIGSLYWRDDGRARWRRKRLQMDREWSVKAPIRYGRLSKSGTYTMVFAQLPAEQFGQGKVIRCKRPATSASDLVIEAEWLWSAEDNKVPRLCNPTPEHRISAGWGCVALLINPLSNIPQTLCDAWTKRVSEEKASDGKHLVDCGGMLQIPWPNVADTGTPVPLDLLLATSNNPKPKNQADLNVAAIVNAWRERDDTYFRRNRDAGIYTFQDRE